MLTPDFNETAAELILANRLSEAEAVLREAVGQMPAGWRPIAEGEIFTSIWFWDQEEFFAHGQRRARSEEESTAWIKGSYSRAWYLLAVAASEQQRFEHALFCVNCGIDLESDHPELWSEKGYLLARLKRFDEALESYRQAASVRNWAPASQIARALRGQGIVLIDLERLDEAEAALNESLAYEPASEAVDTELKYIGQLRQQAAERRAAGPWFIRPFHEPPSDPLTRQLIALVGDLPSIAGPQTVGAGNYSRVAEAFLARGWPGFEEEFDSIVPRDRPDYVDIKRKLLCEPLFSTQAHHNLAHAFAAAVGNSEETVEDVIDEIFATKEEGRPQ